MEEAAPAVFFGRYFAAGIGVLKVTAHNPTNRFLTDVEVAVEFDGDVAIALKNFEQIPALPSPPPEYGTRTEGPLASLSSLGSPMYDARLLRASLPPAAATVGRRTYTTGSNVVRFHVGDLRQLDHDTSEDILVVVRSRPEDGVSAAHGGRRFVIQRPYSPARSRSQSSSTARTWWPSSTLPPRKSAEGRRLQGFGARARAGVGAGLPPSQSDNCVA